jgi:hypothetical protein
MPSRPVRLVVLLTLAVAALGLGACGGSSNRASSDGGAAVLIKETFGANHPIRSGRLDVTLDINLQGLARLPDPVSLHLSGPFQSNGGTTLPDFALDLDVQSGPRPVTIGATFAGGGGWLTIEGQAFDLGKDVVNAFKTGYQKAKADTSGGSAAAPSLAALGISPGRWLREPSIAGTEDIAGQATEHVTAQVDVGRLLADVSALLGKARSVTAAGAAATGTQVPTQITPQQRDEIARSIKAASVDVWTGKDDHTLRKFALSVDIAVPQDLQSKAGGLRTGRIAVQATIAQLNQRQQIVKPANPRPLNDLRAALQQLGLLGSSSSSSSSSGTTASSATPAPSASDPQAGYAQCLAKAGEDLAQVQKCAALLN